MLRVAQMPAHDLDESGVALRGPDRGEVAHQPEDTAGDPQAQAQPDRCRERAVDDRDGARGAAQQDRLRQGTMNGA